MDEACPFCAIIDGAKEAPIVSETDGTLAFLDQNPAATGHTLVVPREHRENVVGTDSDVGDAIFETVDAVASALDTVLEPDGFSVFHTTGSLVGSVSHAHVHVIPRTEDDGIGLSLNRSELDSESGAELADRLADSL